MSSKAKKTEIIKEDWSLEKVSVSSLVEYESNAREYTLKDLANLKASIQKRGVIQPINVSNDFKIVDGHMRFSALIELGIEECWVYRYKKEMSEDEHLEMYLRLNRNIAGVNDFSILRRHFTIEELEDGGFDSMEIEDIVIDPSDIEVVDKPKIYPYEITFDSDEEKKKAEALIDRFCDNHTAEESFELNLISFIKKRQDGEKGDEAKA